MSGCYGTLFFFFFNDTATTEIYTLSLHDALPISASRSWRCARPGRCPYPGDSGCLVLLDPDLLAAILTDGKTLQFAPKGRDRKSTRLNSSHGYISYAVLCLKKKKIQDRSMQSQHP